MSEESLASLVPLWRTIRDQGVTALVTPALDYCGALELGPKDVRFDSPDSIAAVGESLRSLVSSLEDRCNLLFLYRVTDDVEDIIREYEGIAGAAESEALRVYVGARAAWLRGQKMRRVRLYLFFAGPGAALASLSRGSLGGRLVFGKLDGFSQGKHETELRNLQQLRDRLMTRFGKAGINARELSVEDIWRVHDELLNPNRAWRRAKTPSVAVRDNLFADSTIAKIGDHLREYTEAEQLCRESLEDGRGVLRQGDMLRRVLTLKVLPERATDYFAAEPLLRLSLETGAVREPLSYTIAVALEVVHQGRARWALNTRHKLVSALGQALPFFGSSASVEKESADAAHRESIEELFAELHDMSSKIVNVSVSLLLEAPTLARLDTATEGARAAFSEMGNSELETEDLSQIPALLSVLPGAGRYQLRKKGCTSRNAGDLLPVFAPWRGCARAASILTTPDGDAFKFDPFDWTLANAFHGLIAADTGSGKSVTLGFLTLDALASGVQAILVDNGGSWRALTELMGGTYLPINARTSICPFPSYESALDPKTRELDTDELADVVTFLDLCVSGGEGSSFDTVAQHVVSQAVKRVYDQTLRHRPQERPVISLFRDALRTGFSDTQDATLGNDIARRLAIFCEGIYGDLLNRPSVLRFDDKLLTFEMAEVGNHPLAKKLAMATLMRAIADRASQKKRRTLVEVDEAHEYIGTDSVAAQFLASCYRKMRKFDVAMWLISQNLSDFIDSPVGKPIVQNALLKLFLRHQKGKSRDVVIDHFQLSPRARQAFENLEKRDGRYSDILMSYAGRMTTIRLALHPLAYWVLTTDPKDKDLVARARESNPRLSQLELLEHLAARYPHGAAQGRVARAA